jgi:hypothetical protein
MGWFYRRKIPSLARETGDERKFAPGESSDTSGVIGRRYKLTGGPKAASSPFIRDEVILNAVQTVQGATQENHGVGLR